MLAETVGGDVRRYPNTAKIIKPITAKKDTTTAPARAPFDNLTPFIILTNLKPPRNQILESFDSNISATLCLQIRLYYTCGATEDQLGENLGKVRILCHDQVFHFVCQASSTLFSHFVTHNNTK